MLVGADRRLNPGVDPGESRRSRGAAAARTADPRLGYRLRGSVAVITLPAHVEPDCILALRSRGVRAVGGGSRAVAVDLHALGRIDTDTLSELAIALRTISRHRATLAIVGADPRIRLMLELCGIDGVEFHPTVRRALDAVGERRRSARTPVWRRVRRRRPPVVGRSSAR